MQSEEPQQKETDPEYIPMPDIVESDLLDIEENLEALGRSKRKRVLRQAETDALNGCLCRLIVKPSSEGAILCKKKGCETQWVHGFTIPYLNLLTLIISTIYTVSLWSRHPDLGFARLVQSRLKDEEGSATEDGVILPYLDMCLIT